MKRGPTSPRFLYCIDLLDRQTWSHPEQLKPSISCRGTRERDCPQISLDDAGLVEDIFLKYLQFAAVFPIMDVYELGPKSLEASEIFRS